MGKGIRRDESHGWAGASRDRSTLKHVRNQSEVWLELFCFQPSSMLWKGFSSVCQEALGCCGTPVLFPARHSLVFHWQFLECEGLASEPEWGARDAECVTVRNCSGAEQSLPHHLKEIWFSPGHSPFSALAVAGHFCTIFSFLWKWKETSPRPSFFCSSIPQSWHFPGAGEPLVQTWLWWWLTGI